MRYNDIEGESISETWTSKVSYDPSKERWNRPDYTETFTHAAEVPKGTLRQAPSSWTREFKSPKTDNGSFRTIKKSGVIKMTDYDKGKVVFTPNTIRVPRESFLYRTRGAAVVYDKQVYSKDLYTFNLRAPYYLVGDTRRFMDLYPDSSYFRIDEEDVQDEINARVNAVEGNVVSSLNATYDLLTEMAEGRETLTYLLSILQKARHPLKSFADAKKVLDNKNWKGKSVEYHDAVTSLWMQYRYAIMPLVYSVQDVQELIEKRKVVYRTERAKEKIDSSVFNAKPFFEPSSPYFFERMSGTILIRATGKEQRNLKMHLRLIDDIGFNFATTAWELIPYSFVVDWFLNVGDFLSSQIGSLFSLAEQRAFSYSIKYDTVTELVFKDNLDTRETITDGPWVLGEATIFGRTNVQRGKLYSDEYVLHTEKVDSYRRRTFSPHDVGLSLNPFMSWKRWIDAYVLSLGNARSALSALKRR